MVLDFTKYFTLNKKDFILLGIVGIFYFLLIRLTLLLPNPDILITPIGPAMGGALAIFILNPKRRWGAIFILLFISGYVAHLFSNQPMELYPIPYFAYVFGALVSAWMFIDTCGGSIRFTYRKEIFVLIFVAIVITSLSAFIASISDVIKSEEIYWKFYLSRWISSGLGITIFTPLFVLFSSIRRRSSALTLLRVFEYIVFLILWCIVSHYMFLSVELFHPIKLSPYMIFTLLPWVALRFGVRWVALASLIMSIIVFTSSPVLYGNLPFGGDTFLERLQIVQVFLGVTTIGGYLLAASFAETRYNENHLRLLINSAFVAVISIDKTGIVLSWDSQSEKIFGWKEKEALGRNIGDLIIPESLKEKHEKGMERYAKIGIPTVLDKHIEVIGQHKDGKIFPIELFITQIFLEDTFVFTAFIQNISERKKTEEQLRKLSRAMEQSASTVVITDTLGNIEYVNRKFIETTGYTFEEAIGTNPSILKTGFTPNEEYKKLWSTILSGGEWHGEFLNKKKNGEQYWESANISPIVNELGKITHFLAIKEDITAHKLAAVALENSLKEKELLLAEIHHRVKNNLHIISSIIGMEFFFVKNSETIKHLNDTISRIHTMGLLHNKLYQSSNFSEIDMKDYLTSIVENISYIQQIDLTNISFKYEIETIQMNIDTALPCGLIVNEIITNSLKYAFPTGTGEIGISIFYADNTYSMKVYDTGIGIPAEIDFNQNGRLGLKLISSLTRQLHGMVTIEREHGTSYLFSFKNVIKEEKRWKKQKS